MHSCIFKYTIQILTIASVVFLSGCEAQNAGSSFAIQFTFPDDQWPEGTLWLSGRVEERTDIQVRGAVLSVASPVLLEPGATLAFSSIEFGSNRVVVAEIRSTESSSGRTLYYGVSDQFDFNAGDSIVVEVPFELNATPDAETTNTTGDPTGTPSDNSASSMTIGDNNEVNPEAVGTTDVMLYVTTTKASILIVSNDPAFSDENTSRIDFSSNEPTSETETTRSYQLPWSLQGCTSANSVCSQTVYAMFEDNFGYSSAAISDSVVLDTKAPKVIASSVDPSSIKTGVRGEFRLSVDEPLVGLTFSENPADLTSNLELIVTRDGALIESPLFQLIDVSNGEDSGIWQTIELGGQGSLTSGDYVIHANLTDRVGNVYSTQAAEEPLAEFSVDAQAPEVSTPSLLVNGIEDKRNVKLGDTIELSFTASETLAEDPKVYIGTVEMEKVTNEGQSYVYSYTPEFGSADSDNDTLVDGIYIVSVRLVDVATNIGITNLTDNALTFDVVPPSVIDSSAYPPFANQASSLTYQVFLTEAVSSITLTATHASAGQSALIEFNTPTSTGNVYTFEPLQALSTEVEGIYYPTLTLEDLAGNTNIFVHDPSSDAISLASFTLDSTNPVISDLELSSNNEPGDVSNCGSTNPATAAVAAEGDTLTLEFTGTDTDSSGILDIPKVTIGDQPMECSANVERYTCVLTVNAEKFTDGSKNFNITVTDAAGNSEYQEFGTVCIDTTSPTAQTSVQPAPAKIGSNIVYQAVFSEAVMGTTITATHTNGIDTLELIQDEAASSGNLYVWKHTVEPSTALPDGSTSGSIEGTYSVLLQATDQAGNASGTIVGESIQIDSSYPSAELVGDITTTQLAGASITAPDKISINSQSYDHVIYQHTITAVIQLSDQTADTLPMPEVTIGGVPIVSLVLNGNNRWEATYTVTADLGDGLADIQATVRDLAGNEKVYTIATVFVDQTAPSLAFLTTSPELISNEGTATVILNFDELVRGNINLFYQSDDGTTDLLNGSTESCEINSSTSATALGATNLADLVLGSSFVCTITTPFVDGTPESLYASSYALEVYAEDFAGNARTFSTTEVDVALRFDQTAAQLEISELSTGRMTSHTNESERFTTVNRGDRDAVSGVLSEVTFKINSTEPLDTLSAFIGDYELSQAECGNTETSANGGTIITCAYTLTGLEEDGYQRLKVTATDLAGNITTFIGDIDNAEACVLFDFTPPTVSYSSVSPEIIPGNGTGMLTAIFSEPVQDLAYELQFKTGEEWAASTEASITTNLTPTENGLMARYRIFVGGGTLANRRHQAQATGHDLSGNEFSQTINDIFTIDQVAPDLCAHTDTCSPKYQVGTWEDDAITRYFVNLNDKQAGSSIAVVFGVTESLGSNPTVTIGSRPFGSSCEVVPNVSTVVYRCLYQMSGNETSGLKEIVVTVVDDAGNTTYRSLGDFLFDFDSPTFIAPIISYEPPTNSPVSRVMALSNGSKANLTFSTDQLTRLSNIQLKCGTNTYSLGESSEDGNSFRYEIAFNNLAPSPADGICQAQASLSDLMWIKPPANGIGPGYMMSIPTDAASYTLTQIGNTGESLSEEILIDNTAPTLSTIISTSNLKHLRMPNGALQANERDGDGYVSSQYIVDNSLDDLSAAPTSTLPIAYFDMGEGNGTSSADGTASCSENDDCSGTSMCNYQSGLCITARLLRFYNQDSTGTGANQGTLLGSIDFLTYDDSGSVSSVNLSTDSPEVWVEAVDTAGNISSRQALTTEWIVSLSGRTSLNGSVHPATGQQVSVGSASRAQGYADDIDESHGLGAVGGDTLQTAGSQTWQDLTLKPGTELPSNLMAPGLVYDQGRHKVILFSGENSDYQDNQLWEYDVDTKRWSSQRSPLAPTGRSGAMLVYDSIREVLVFFGGTTNSNVNDVEAFYADTWEYTLSSSTWTKIIPTTTPSPRALSFAEFDESSGRVILFGGVTTKEDGSDNISLNDTWAYDTSTQDWTQLTTDTAPSPRHAGTMRINPSTKKMFLFGGETKAGDGTPNITFQDDLWIFDPTTVTWEEVSQTNTPGAVGSFGMVYDSERERLVLFGGRTGFGAMTDTGPSSIVREQQWEFNPQSNAWQQIAVEGSPAGKCSFGMVYVPSSKEIITYGGQSLATALSETTDYKAATNRWVQRATTANVPPSDRRGNAMVEITNTNDLFLFGGYTWDIPLVDGVPDPGSPELVMLNETWTFAEENLRWTEVDLPSGGPGPVADHQMVYTQRADPADNRVILFGGRTTVPPEAGSENGGSFGQGYQGSTWAYNPTEIASERWKEVLEDGQGPTARIGHAMAYSTAQNMVVLYGGQIGDRYLADDYPNDTWVYDVAEAEWTNITGSVGAPPSARSFAKMVYMPDLDKFLLVGGVYVAPSGGDGPPGGPPGAPPGGGGDGEGESASYSVNAETWTFDLQTQTWTQLTPANSPTAVFAQYMAYNPRRGRVLMYGGNIDEFEVMNQTWEYDPIGNDWERVKPLKSGGPRGNGAMAWDSQNNTMNVFGGAQFETSFEDHWVLVPGEATHTLAVSTEQILLPDNTALQGIKAIWRAGATSTGWLPASETTNGASLFVWDTTLGWRLVATNSEPSTNPGYVQWSSTDANDVRRLSAETNTTLNFMVRPTSGKESKESYLVSDYAEIRVTYTPGQN